ncbi:MAG: hypothetical protein ACI4CS_05300, partial [Candidatus Weimeria sp.]
MFDVPVNIFYNVDSVVFDIILQFFLIRQYGNTMPHSMAFRKWLLTTMVASVSDAVLRTVFTMESISASARILYFALDFAIAETAMFMMIRYAYVYYMGKKTRRTKLLVACGVAAAVIITCIFISDKGFFALFLTSFLLYVIFLAVESRDYKQIKILMERVENENKEAEIETEAKEKLFADVSEKISVPLHMIRVDAMHMEQASGKSQTKEYARQILSSSEMLGFLI